MEIVKVEGQVREEFGTNKANALRNEGKIPCIIYGHGDVRHFTADPRDFKELLYTPDFKICQLTLGEKEYKCILKEAQFHPVTEDLLHVDLQALLDGAKLKVDIPLRLKGKPEGLQQGGRLTQSLRKISIKTTPKYLVSEIVLDISDMEMKDSRRIKDIDVPEGIEILNSPGIPVATVMTPRVLKVIEPEEDELLEGEEGEELEEGEEAAEGGEGEAAEAGGDTPE